MKPKASTSTTKSNLTNQTTQNRITEKFSPSLPSLSSPPRPRPIFHKFAGQRLRLLLRDGVVIIGTVRLQLWDFIRLDNVEEVGKDYRVTGDFALVDVTSIARIFPASARFEVTGDK